MQINDYLKNAGEIANEMKRKSRGAISEQTRTGCDNNQIVTIVNMSE